MGVEVDGPEPPGGGDGGIRVLGPGRAELDADAEAERLAEGPPARQVPFLRSPHPDVECVEAGGLDLPGLALVGPLVGRGGVLLQAPEVLNELQAGWRVLPVPAVESGRGSEDRRRGSEASEGKPGGQRVAHRDSLGRPAAIYHRGGRSGSSRILATPQNEPPLRQASRPVRDPRASRRGRDGRGLPRARHAPRARGRGQGPVPGVRRGPGPPRALRAGGARRLGPEPPEHRHDLRHRPDESTIYIAMELVDGKTLREVLQAGAAADAGGSSTSRSRWPTAWPRRTRPGSSTGT